MSPFTKNITPFVEAELTKADNAKRLGNYINEFTHLENAHVLGQESTYWHVMVHFRMLAWGIRQSDFKEISGQLLRIIGAAALTAIKGVPIGNTGGSNVSPIKVMPISSEYAEIIANAKKIN